MQYELSTNDTITARYVESHPYPGRMTVMVFGAVADSAAFVQTIAS
jgi:hypothetical protein